MSLILVTAFLQLQAQLQICYNETSNLAGYCEGDKIIIPQKYGNAGEFRDGRAIVEEHGTGKVGMINEKGEMIMPFQYDAIHFCNSFPDRLLIRSKHHFGIITLDGKTVIPPQYEAADEYASTFRIDGDAYFEPDAWLLLKLNGKAGLLDTQGKTLLPFEYDRIVVVEGMDTSFRDFPAGAVALKGSKMTVFNKDIKPVPELDGYELLGIRFSNGIFAKGGVFKFFYFSKSALSNTLEGYQGKYLILSNLQEKYGVVDPAGKFVVDFKYDHIKTIFGGDEHPSDDFLFFKSNNKWGVLNPSGQVVIPADHEDVDIVCLDNNKLLKARKVNGKWALFSHDGKSFRQASPYKYDELSCGTDEGSAIMLNGKEGILKADGTEKWNN